MTELDATPTPKPKRSRGGQPGKLNALKHGFYTRHFRQMDLKDLDVMLEHRLDSEINMLREYTRRVLELAQGNEDLEAGIRLLTALGVASSRLSNLLRSQALLGGSRKEDIYNQVVEALAEVNK